MNNYIKSLYNKRQEIDKKIKDHQEKCKHLNVKKVPGANTGNIFEPNIYWNDCLCLDCNKWWKEDQ